MADTTTTKQTPNQLNVSYEQQNFELGNNRHDYKTTIAATADDTVYGIGQMLAMNPADGTITKFDKTGVDTPAAGEDPAVNEAWKAVFYGFNTIAVSLDDTETAELRIVISGDVCQELILPQADLNYCIGAQFNTIQTSAPISGTK